MKRFNCAITVVRMVIKMLDQNEDTKRQWTMYHDELMKKHTCSLKAALLRGSNIILRVTIHERFFTVSDTPMSILLPLALNPAETQHTVVVKTNDLSFSPP